MDTPLIAKKKSPLSTELKARVVGMNQEGLKVAQIARDLQLSTSTVYSILANCKTVETPKRSGRPPKLSDRDERSLGCVLVNNRCAMLAKVTNQLPTKMSTRTIR